MRALHGNWFWLAVATTGVVGAWGLVLRLMNRSADRWFKVGVGVATAAMLVQVGLGLVIYQQGFRTGNDFHIFYGFLVLFSFAFAYIFRAQMSRRFPLAWGLLLLFVMGLGLRAWSNVN